MLPGIAGFLLPHSIPSIGDEVRSSRNAWKGGYQPQLCKLAKEMKAELAATRRVNNKAGNQGSGVAAPHSSLVTWFFRSGRWPVTCSIL
jgi:hypothetical protein